MADADTSNEYEGFLERVGAVVLSVADTDEAGARALAALISLWYRREDMLAAPDAWRAAYTAPERLGDAETLFPAPGGATSADGVTWLEAFGLRLREQAEVAGAIGWGLLYGEPVMLAASEPVLAHDGIPLLSPAAWLDREIRRLAYVLITEHQPVVRAVVALDGDLLPMIEALASQWIDVLGGRMASVLALPAETAAGMLGVPASSMPSIISRYHADVAAGRQRVSDGVAAVIAR